MEILTVPQYRNAYVVVLTLSALCVGNTAAIQLCQYGVDTTHTINLNMDSSEISGSRGMCSCRIQLIDGARLSMYPYITIPGCNTSVSLSDSSFEFTCSNGKTDSLTPYIREKTAGDVLWLFVTSTDVSQAMSGQLQIKTRSSSSQFKLECFDANTNTSITTLIPTTTTSTTTDTIITKAELEVSSTPTKPDREGSSTMASQVNPSSTEKSDGSTVPTVSTSANISPTDGTLTGDNKKNFPVAAVAGGIAGGLLLVLVVILACVCFRKRHREPKLRENGESKSQGYHNQVYDTGVPNIGRIKPQDTQPPEISDHVQVGNDFYVSADTNNQPHHPQVEITNSVPGHYAGLDEVNNEKSDDASVEGSEIVITSSGDLYAVVDKSKHHQNHQEMVSDPYPTTSPADVYAVVEKSKKHQDRVVSDPDPTAFPADVYAVVNKKQAPQDTAQSHMVSPSGDIYAVVDKKPEADPNHQVTRSSIHDEEEDEAIKRVMDMTDERLGSGTQESTAL